MLLFLRKQENIIIGTNSNNRLFFAFLSITVVIFMVRLYSCIIWENETKFLEVLQNCSPKGPSLHAQQEPARMLSLLLIPFPAWTLQSH